MIDFALPDQDGKIHSLKQYLGKWVVLYVYTKDDTPGCTTEACGFRDSFHKLEEKGAVILGLSKDSMASHQKFAEKYHLNFPILSDEKLEVIKSLGAWDGKVLRTTFLINPQGEIAKTYKNVNPINHAQAILKDL